MDFRYILALAIVAFFPGAAKADDWYGIDQTTFTCVDITKSDAPFHNPEEYLIWAHKTEGWLTKVTVEPNVFMGRWVKIEDISDDDKATDLGTVDFIQPKGECEAILDDEQSRGILPSQNDLK